MMKKKMKMKMIENINVKKNVKKKMKMNYYNKSYINTKSQNNLKKIKTERSNLQLNYNKKNQNKKLIWIILMI